MNKDVMDLVEKAKTEKVSYADTSAAAIKVLNEFLITKLNLTEEEVAAIRSNTRYNNMRRAIAASLRNSVDEATKVSLRENRQKEEEEKRMDRQRRETTI